MLEGDDAIEAAGEIEIVGRDQCRETGTADQVEECLQHAFAGRLIEIAGWFVAEQDLGVVGERAGDRDALLLAARETCRAMPGARCEADLEARPPFPAPAGGAP